MPLSDPVPDLQSLDLLRSVAKLGSIRQAARVHNISQPAASMRLRNLEKVLGLKLMDRLKGGAQLTASGEAISQWSEEVVDSMVRLLAGASAISVTEKPKLTIVASMTVAEYLIPTWLVQLKVHMPDAVVLLKVGNSDFVKTSISKSGGDIGFVEGVSKLEGFDSKVIQKDELSVFIAPTHPWAKRKHKLSALELARTPLVIREKGSGTREVIENALGAMGLGITSTVEMGSTTSIKSAVLEGNVPGILSKLALKNEIDDGSALLVPVEDLNLMRNIRAIWPHKSPLSQTAKYFLHEIVPPMSGMTK
ncbi:MAG: LysR family transcriptional regulator [Acidimicrobiales bacterium]|nr:LysR family transcriptional regulator [Acidimicrobiales bacterium]